MITDTNMSSNTRSYIEDRGKQAITLSIDRTILLLIFEEFSSLILLLCFSDSFCLRSAGGFSDTSSIKLSLNSCFLSEFLPGLSISQANSIEEVVLIRVKGLELLVIAVDRIPVFLDLRKHSLLSLRTHYLFRKFLDSFNDIREVILFSDLICIEKLLNLLNDLRIHIATITERGGNHVSKILTLSDNRTVKTISSRHIVCSSLNVFIASSRSPLSVTSILQLTTKEFTSNTHLGSFQIHTLFSRLGRITSSDIMSGQTLTHLTSESERSRCYFTSSTESPLTCSSNFFRNGFE